MAYSGRYRVKNRKKYEGDFNKVKYRSLWERQTFKWLDNNPGVIGWSSEEVIIPYRCKTDGKIHRYFVDLFIRTKDGKIFLIEIKPKKQTLPSTCVSCRTGHRKLWKTYTPVAKSTISLVAT